jgi:hypothetical protein
MFPVNTRKIETIYTWIKEHNTENWAKYRALSGALITEEDVSSFKFVFLYFKQNREKYRN